MKKRILLFSALGLAAGLFYVLEANWRQQNGEEDAPKPKLRNPELSAKSPDQTASLREVAKSTAAPGHSASMGRIGNGKAVLMQEKARDDSGIDQIEAAQILKNIRDSAFDSSDEKLALALGRPAAEIAEWIDGNGSIDGDAIMKARTLAIQRESNAE